MVTFGSSRALAAHPAFIVSLSLVLRFHGFDAVLVLILVYWSFDDGLYDTKLNVPAEKDN